jgi:hypothetical protein
MAGRRVFTIAIAMFMMVALLAATALAAPTNNKKSGDLDNYDEGQCSWTGSPKQWVCVDDPEEYDDPDNTGNNNKNSDKKWSIDEETSTNSGPGNSGKNEETVTQVCVYNPGGKLSTSKSTDPEGTCPLTN